MLKFSSKVHTSKNPKMNTAASKVAPLIVSRTALQRLTKKYPQYLKEKVVKSKAKKDDSTWPVSMQRFGYGAVALSIPYSMMIVIAESPRLRATLEGDPGSDDRDHFGRKVVDFVRWFWGHEDTIPYSEYVEIEGGGEDQKEISLESDISAVERSGQEIIQRQLRDELKVKAETDGDGEERFGKIDGRLPASDIVQVWNTIGMGADNSAELAPEQVYLTFEDDENVGSSEGDVSMSDIDSVFTSGNVGQTPSQELVNLTSIWSAWYHFADSTTSTGSENTAPSTNSRAVADPYHSAIEELNLELEDVEKDLRDPFCIKNRDDMETEIQRIRKEIGALKKERRMHKLKKFVSLSS